METRRTARGAKTLSENSAILARITRMGLARTGLGTREIRSVDATGVKEGSSQRTGPLSGLATSNPPEPFPSHDRPAHPWGSVHSDRSDFRRGRVRSDFPPLNQEIRPGIPLVYLDSAATSLKPSAVVNAVREYLAEYPANVHRGLHTLSERATEAFEGAREKIARFLGVADSAQIVFTRGTTDAINLVAQSWGQSALQAGDEIVVSELEHHANLVPWQMLARSRGVVLRFIELTDDCRLDLDVPRSGDLRTASASSR